MRWYLIFVLLCVVDALGVADEVATKGLESRFRVTTDDCRTVNLEGQSWVRDEYIEKYIRLLATSNAEIQAHAAWALGRIQSPKAVEALLACRTYVTNEFVLRLVSESAQVQFSCMLPDSGEIDVKPYVLLRNLARAYETNGYEGLLLGIFHRVSKTEEACQMFVRNITKTYDPHLAKVLILIYPDIKDEGLKEQMELGILNCAGIDISRIGVVEALSILEKPDALTPERTVARYLEYFRKKGYKGSDTEVFWKVIATADENAHRMMAYRGLQMQAQGAFGPTLDK